MSVDEVTTMEGTRQEGIRIEKVHFSDICLKTRVIAVDNPDTEGPGPSFNSSTTKNMDAT